MISKYSLHSHRDDDVDDDGGGGSRDWVLSLCSALHLHHLI